MAFLMKSCSLSTRKGCRLREGRSQAFPKNSVPTSRRELAPPKLPVAAAAASAPATSASTTRTALWPSSLPARHSALPLLTRIPPCYSGSKTRVSPAPATLTDIPSPSPSALASRHVSELYGRLNEGDPIVLWYRNDLRVDDHPGLAAAAAACRHSAVSASVSASSPPSSEPRPLVPLYIVDPARLSHLVFSAGGPEALAAALGRLRGELRSLGSDLVVRVGAWEQQLTKAVWQVGAKAVVSEQEVEVKWRQPALDALLQAHDNHGAESYTWQAALWPASAFDVQYRVWRDQRGRPGEPLPPPPAPLPPLPSSIDPGPIPSGQELRRLLTEAAMAAYERGRDGNGGFGNSDGGVAAVARQVVEACGAGPEAERALRVSAGPGSPLEMLRQYLGTAPAPAPAASASAFVSIDEEVEALRRPGVDGAPFTGLFSAAKALGTLSARRVLWEAYRADGRPYGSVEPRRLRSPAAVAAAVAAEAADFHRALAVLDDNRVLAPGVEVHFWRWRGALTDYCVAEPAEARPGAPAVLLVHGFGAFGDQWRDNMGALAAAGFRVFAPTFPGFGRSQKVAMPYSQDLWRDFLRDFVLQVAGSRVLVAGNSIGGFISTCLAADYPQLVAGLVLINSAGPVNASFNIDSWRAAVAAGRSPPPALVVSAVSSALFWYLERTVPSTLRWLYPTNPSRADEWLATEILRAAGDSGAIDVFKSVWYVPTPRALNWLIKDAWRGPTLVLQGVLDPLNDARSRARELGELCPNVEVQFLEAGHCPHDEVPEQVNASLLAFIRKAVLGQEPQGDSSTAAGGAVAAPAMAET